jgi:hypothetical protein
VGPDVAPLELIQGELESGPEKGPDDEAQEAYGRADHCHPERARGRDEDSRPVPQARDQRGERLHHATKITDASKFEEYFCVKAFSETDNDVNADLLAFVKER